MIQIRNDKEDNDKKREGKVLRVLLSGRWLPRNQGLEMNMKRKEKEETLRKRKLISTEDKNL